jgi:hypothetical protein
MFCLKNNQVIVFIINLSNKFAYLVKIFHLKRQAQTYPTGESQQPVTQP